MKHSGEHETFTNLVDRALSTSRDEMKRREDEYRKRAGTNPRKRGPKRKAVKQPFASPYSVV